MERERLETPRGSTECRPGRPRSESRHQAVIDAARELLAEHGLEGLRIETVAARAGVGKALIYRHWGGKPRLVQEVLATCHCGLAAPDTGSLAGDLDALLSAVVIEPTGEAEQLLPRLAELASDPELRPIVAAAVLQPREALVADVLERAVARGEVPADLDVQMAVEMVLGAVLYWKVTSAELTAADVRSSAHRIAALLTADPTRTATTRTATTRTAKARTAKNRPAQDVTSHEELV